MVPIPQLKKRKVKNLNNVIIPRSTGRQNNRRNKKKNKGFLRRLFKIVFFLSIIFLIIGGLISIGSIIWFSKDLPTPDKLIERKMPLTTKMYDRTGKTVLYEIHGEQKRTFIPIEEIPNYAIQATIAIEDKNFFQHKGISLWGIFRGVVVAKIKGERVRGGSTITQQLIKNAVLTNERKISRKIKEWILAWRIEKKFTKNEILQLYFNEIPYGSTAYGIESASNLYFGKSARELTIAESAILAALPKAPTYYSPYGSHKDKLLGRQQYILKLMKEQGYIDEQQLRDAEKEELVFVSPKHNIIAPHFVMYIKEVLSERYGEKIVEQGGLNVVTTIDLEIQEKAENAINKYSERNEKQYNATNAALVAIEPKTGQILSMVGSRDYFDVENDGNVNVAIRLRQPGSSIKPLVYSTAFTLGYTPDTILYDTETNFGVQGAKEYVPHNYDGIFRGPVSIRKSLAGSLNVPAVKMLYLTGIDRVVDYAQNMGYTTLSDKSRFGLSLVLGGAEVKLLEHVGAYSVFANDGISNKTTGIIEVRDSSGEILEEFKVKDRRVMDKQSVRLLNSVLSDNSARAYAFGENNLLNLGSIPVCAKTGTTNDYKDAWTIGYTPSITTGVWVGNNNGSEMKIGAGGSTVAAPIWNNFMNSVLVDQPIQEFVEPSNITFSNDVSPIIKGYIPDDKELEIDKFSGKLATEYTPEIAIIKKTFKELHSILHYIDKSNPLGLKPDNPGTDYQYNGWEESIIRWASEQVDSDIDIGIAPTDFDDVHTPENRPTVKILGVSDDEVITDKEININTVASAPRGVSVVEYWVDDSFIGMIKNPPFDFRWVINIPNGKYKLKAVAYDDVFNKSEDVVNINIETNNHISE